MNKQTNGRKDAWMDENSVTVCYQSNIPASVCKMCVYKHVQTQEKVFIGGGATAVTPGVVV